MINISEGRTIERQKFLARIGLIMLAAVLTYRGLQFWHWYTIGWDMKSYNPYMPVVDFLAGHAFLATAIVASLPFVYYISALINYLYDSIIIYGMVKWGYMSYSLAFIEIIVIILEFIIVMYLIRKFWLYHLKTSTKGIIKTGGYKA